MYGLGTMPLSSQHNFLQRMSEQLSAGEQQMRYGITCVPGQPGIILGFSLS